MLEATCRGIIRIASALVPASSRSDWRAEWMAELETELQARQQWPQRGGPVLLSRCFGAFMDAAWMRLLLIQHGIWLDIRFGARALRRDPGFTVVALATLALAIGANTAVFGVAYGVLHRPLPFRDPERLVWLSQYRPMFRFEVMTWPDVEKVRQCRSFESVAPYTAGRTRIASLGDGVNAKAASVAPEFFPTLGISPQLGRAFTSGDAEAQTATVAILEHAFWRKHFGGDRGVLGRTLRLSDGPVTIVGVMPPRYSFPDGAEIWLPLWRDIEKERRGSWRLLDTIARLRPGVTLEQARAEFDARLREPRPANAPPSAEDSAVVVTSSRAPEVLAGSRQGNNARVEPLREHLVQGSRIALDVLWAAVTLMLVIACVNIANLTLARSAARRREVAVRIALGAGRFRIARQMVIESLLIALGGGALGVAALRFIFPAMVDLLPQNLPRIHEIDLGAGAWLYAAGASAACGLVFGMLPALGWRGSIGEALKASARRSAGAASGAGLRTGLAATQLTLALVLLLGAGLLLKSFVRLLATDPGYRADGLIVMSLEPPRHAGEDERNTMAAAVLDRVRRVPGIAGASAAGAAPFLGQTMSSPFFVEGRPVRREDIFAQNAAISDVNPEYFSVMGVPLLAGRNFDIADQRDGSESVIISRSVARSIFPREDPIGKRLRMGIDDRAPGMRVIGVAGDFRSTLDKEPGMVIYRPARGAVPFLVARSAVEPSRGAADIRKAVRETAPDASAEVHTIDELVRRSAAPQRFRTVLVGGFALVALALAGVGLYGVLSYLVSQRTYELGVRMAIGASPGDIRRMVLAQAAKVVAIGTAAGLMLAWAVTRYLASLLYNLSPRDPVTFGIVPLLLAAIAFAACWAPMRRAMKLDPAAVLRADA
ncbi:MAG TPA: ABC transporter permease [Bryobacteraceae bacterium]|nr:ABC transporter permease [Bryobacteraceae bacterium]